MYKSSISCRNGIWAIKARTVHAGPAGAAKDVKGDAHVALRSKKSEALHAAEQPAENGSKAQKVS